MHVFVSRTFSKILEDFKPESDHVAAGFLHGNDALDTKCKEKHFAVFQI
jgi:hypothetical protein